MSTLPTPDADALAYSAALEARIAGEIDAAGGWIGFARFMELALYAPGLGYYSGGAHKFGAAGDFVTAPEISPFFGRTLAAQATREEIEAELKFLVRLWQKVQERVQPTCEETHSVPRGASGMKTVSTS